MKFLSSLTSLRDWSHQRWLSGLRRRGAECSGAPTRGVGIFSKVLLALTLATALLPATTLANDLPRFPPISVDDMLSEHGQVFTESTPNHVVGTATLSIFAGLDRQAYRESGVAAVTAELVLATPVQLDGREQPLLNAVASLGGVVTYALKADTVCFTLTARTPDLPIALNLLATALRAPDIQSSTLQRARDIVDRKAAALSESGLSIAIFAFRDAYYRKTNAGLPLDGTKAQVDALTPDMVRDFFRQTYRRTSSAIAIVGTVSPEIQHAARALIDTLPAGSSALGQMPPRQPLVADTKVRSFRSGLRSLWDVLGFPAPAVTSPDFGGMIVFYTLLQNALTRDSITTTASDDQLLGVNYDFESNPANLLIYVNGSGNLPTLAFGNIEVILESLSTHLLASDKLERLKRIAEGRYMLTSLSSSERSDDIVSLANLGLGVDGSNLIIQSIDAVTPQDVQHIVQRYCRHFTLSTVLTH